MKTFFGLFEEYGEADAAVRGLLATDFAIDEINVILQETIAKNAMDADWNEIKIQKSQELGQTATHGLDGLLGGEQAFNLPHIGRVFATGELANLLTKTAVLPGSVDGGLQAALIEFGLSEETAEVYQQGVENGGLLVFFHFADEKASDARQVLRENKAQQIMNAIR